jgi:hypothetical protein
VRDVDDLVAILVAGLPRFIQRFEPNYGYGPGENALVGDAGSSLGERELNVLSELPPDARHFFTTYGGVWLPDLWNGVFLGPVPWIARVRSELKEVATTSRPAPVLAIGSDGGGGHLVVDRRDPGPVAHLGVGALEDGLLSLQADPTPSPTLDTHVVAPSFLELLNRIVSAVHRAADGDNRNPFA